MSPGRVWFLETAICFGLHLGRWRVSQSSDSSANAVPYDASISPNSPPYIKVTVFDFCKSNYCEPYLHYKIVEFCYIFPTKIPTVFAITCKNTQTTDSQYSESLCAEELPQHWMHFHRLFFLYLLIRSQNNTYSK